VWLKRGIREGEILMINEQDAKEKLETFLKDTYDLLKELVYEGIDEEKRPFFIEDLSNSIHAAWEEFEEDFKIEHAVAQIQQTDAKRLQASGLYGQQLDLKLSVVEIWKNRFLNRRIKKILLKLLDAIDTVLRSLIEAIGMGHALEEIKDILRNSIDED
jgi:hypothetical protein